MDISLEKIDEIVSRTGVSYAKAKEVLMLCNGDVVDSLIYLEKEYDDYQNIEKNDDKIKEISDYIKQLIQKGNVTRIIISRNSKVIIDIPVTMGAVIGVFFAGYTFASIAVAIISGCDLKVITKEGKVLELSAEILKEKFNLKQKEDVSEFDVDEDVIIYKDSDFEK